MRSENKNTCSWLLRKESVYKKMSLSLDYPCFQRATVCHSGLIWSCCSFVEILPHIPYSGPFNLFLWWGLLCQGLCNHRRNLWGRVAKTCWKCWSVGAIFLVGVNFWERHAKNCAIMSIFATMLWRGPPVLWRHELWIGQVKRCCWLNHPRNVVWLGLVIRC